MAKHRARIAVINDDTNYLQLIHDLLEEEEGYNVTICKEADDAYTFVKRWMILNLLTLDPATRPIPVLVRPAAIQSFHEHEEPVQQYDCDVLPKPFDLDARLDKVEAALAKHRRD